MVSVPSSGPAQGHTPVAKPSQVGTTASTTPAAATPSMNSGPKTKPQAQSTPGTSTPVTGGSIPNGVNIPLSARRADPLDLTSVRRRGQHRSEEPKKKKQNRMFGLTDAPVYRPTEDEFRDPMEYMRKIAPEGKRYGIAKIIPPAGWNPPFAINTERFHFRVRRQELNSVEGGNRVNNDYLDQLAKFHKQHGQNLNRFPTVDKRPLDLYRLKKTVERKGGFDQVCKSKRWAEVGRDLGYSGKIMSSLSTSLKNSYQRWLLPYEEYLRLARPGVQQQLEAMNGGPYTPSPTTSPAKKSPNGVAHHDKSAAQQASAALQAQVADRSDARSPPPAFGGFTPVNATGGFTAVNAAVSPAAFAPTNGHVKPADPITNGVGTPQPEGSDNPLKRSHNGGPLSQDDDGRRSKRLRKDVPTVIGSNMHHSRMSAGRPQSARTDFSPGELCPTCGKADEPSKLLECQSCDNIYHMHCLEPPLKIKPDYEWHCPRCLVGTGEYGFEDGDVYSLSAFQAKADRFKTQHFTDPPSEDDVEREFWRLVEDLDTATEVEYGADIHSTTHGSGFPTIEKQPKDPYSTDPWNLNIMPLDKESLFRHIKSDISGMTVPWLYVGMVFSTFCWHNEDHFTYSANYQHFGETKTWYGIPAEDTDAFEAAMREEVPELFESQPDILFQLVTLARPDKLRRAGVRVFAVDQHAGEFVITFPKAYHAGFNHGFNFNEAVNFAPQDWEPTGREGVQRLRDYRKQPCFSHDELLLTASSRDHTIRTAKWLAPALQRMRDEEIAGRKHFLNGPDGSSGVGADDAYSGPRYGALPDIADLSTDDEEVNCAYCKCCLYLSRYKCHKSDQYLCALHAGSYQCCDALEVERYSGQGGTHRLYYHIDDDALNAIVQKVSDKAQIPETWSSKVDNELLEDPCPSLKVLRTLLAEGEKIQYDLPQLPELKRFVERCNEWVEDATNYITRKHVNRRKEKSARKSSVKTGMDPEDREKEMRKLENIHKLLSSAESISFDCPEIETLRQRADAITRFQRDANYALHHVGSIPLNEYEELIQRGREFSVDMPEMESLERVVMRLRWDETAKAMRPHPETRRQDRSLQEIENFIEEGLKLGVPESNTDIMYFREHKAQGELWEQKAKELMSAEQVNYQQLDSLSSQSLGLAVDEKTLGAVEGILRKQRELQDKISSLIARTKHADVRQRPLYGEMRQVMSTVEELQSKPPGTIDLEKESKRHEDWMRKGKKLFGKSNAPLHILHQHMKIVEQRNASCFDTSDKPRMPVEPSSRQHTPVEGEAIADGSGSSRDVFCICRRPEAGMMIECEFCHEWYHGKCLKIARGKVKEEDKYTCPICDWRVKIPRDAARPKLEDLLNWQDELDNLPFQPDEEGTLSDIINTAQSYRDSIRPIIHSGVSTTPEEVAGLRFHLRKIEGADILLAEETNFLRQELHKWAPIAPVAPPLIDQSQSTRKPRPTKQQKLMASLGITNPNDLPQEYKIKPHSTKRKGSEHLAGSAAGSPPISSPGTSMRPGGAKPYLTALAVQVLGDLAAAPVVSKMLQNEPHMNRDKLLRMKAVLESDPDPSVREDTAVFTERWNRLPPPKSHTPGLSYETAQERALMASTGAPGRPSMLFRSPSNDHLSQQPRLASPARFDSPPVFHHGNATPPAVHGLDHNMFDASHASMFDSPSNDGKRTSTSPGYPVRPNLFDSPKQSHLGHHLGNSPSYADVQGGSHVDNVFADLVHDQDGADDNKMRVSGTTDPALLGPDAAVHGTMDVEMTDASSLQRLAQRAAGVDDPNIDPALA